MDFGNYIVYVDESGDHAMGESIDKSFPIFVLAFCVFKKDEYANIAIPAMKKLKFKYFGHDIVNLHEREIRKAKNKFSFLVNAELRENFFHDLNNMIKNSPFAVISTVIKKGQMACQTKNPYNMAMQFCLERLYKYLRDKGELGKTTHIIFERRGENEDRKLELEFRRIIAKGNLDGAIYPFEIEFATKQTNSAGLQLADMVARPIGISVLHPYQMNRAYEIIEQKIHRDKFGSTNGYGLKVFP
mgnify:CR=1 FL=1